MVGELRLARHQLPRGAGVPRQPDRQSGAGLAAPGAGDGVCAAGIFWPSVGADYNFERQKLPGNTATSSAPGIQGNGQVLVPSAPAQPLTFNFQTAELTVGFVPDVFGENRRKVESLDAQAQNQRFELEATYISLASNVVAAAIQEASTRAQLKATHEIIAHNEKSVAILRDKFEHGYASAGDLASQELQLAQAKSQLPPLQKQFEQNRDLIRELVGNLPDQDVSETFDLASLKLPTQLPLSLPSRIIEQRPDIRAAEEAMRSANANVGAAIAAMLPQFTITGYGGRYRDTVRRPVRQGRAVLVADRRCLSADL